MNKINKNIIIYYLAIILIVFTFAITATVAKANTIPGGYITSVGVNTSTAREDNPKPSITSISPSSSNVGVGTKTITVTGTGFVPSSITRINGSNRPTTFIDSSHLLVQITGNDTLKYLSNGGFFITVFNGAPGGGNSNASFFTINKSVSSLGTTTNNANDTTTNFTDIIQNDNDTESNFSNLASNAIFGSNGIYPSGLIQWIFFAIIVLLIVILVRKVYGADKKYHATPLKHEY